MGTGFRSRHESETIRQMRRKPRHRLWTRPVRGLALICLALGACDLDDSRDRCCDNLVMEYCYRPYEVEAFAEHIHSLKHYLFDQQGDFLGEVPPGDNLRWQPLSLDAGSYTLVTVGNTSEKTSCGFAPDDGLENFKLAVGQFIQRQDVFLENGDQLYWGVCQFSVGQRQGGDPPARRLVTYMNNIHCHLEIKVVWHNVPQYDGNYTLDLRGVPAGYSLCPDRCSSVEGFIIPPTDGPPQDHRLEVPLVSQELYAQFITLRFSDLDIPTLSIRFADKPVTGPIDLGKAFRQWGWYPSKTHIQKYRILVKIFGDGTVEVSPWVEASVQDWENGGNFG